MTVSTITNMVRCWPCTLYRYRARVQGMAKLEVFFCLSQGKAEEGSAEEYSQLQRQKPPKAVANISDANYSHFEGVSNGFIPRPH